MKSSIEGAIEDAEVIVMAKRPGVRRARSRSMNGHRVI